MSAQHRARHVCARGMTTMVMALSLVLGYAFLGHHAVAHADVSGFVTRSGSHLMLNGQSYRFSGADDFTFVLDGSQGESNESIGGADCLGDPCAYTTPFRIEQDLATAQEMGANVLRVYSFPGSVGCELCVQTTVGTFNETALQHLDYAVHAASSHNIRLILGLSNKYHGYDGGIHDWVNPGTFAPGGAGPTPEEATSFYTDPVVIARYEKLIDTLLNRTNTYTGVQYKNDPTVLAWELGNELSDEPVSWVTEVSNYIKNIDSNHLVSDSPCCFLPSDQDFSPPNVDLYDEHQYPTGTGATNFNAQRAADAGKAYFIGEYDWPNYTGGNGPLNEYLSNIESNTNVAGDLYFELATLADTYGFLKPNTPDCACSNLYLHYPEQDPTRRTIVQQLRTHAYVMQGISPAPAHAALATPLITNINGKVIAWRGVAGADTYDVERSTTSATDGFDLVCDRCATDFTTPWTDNNQPGGTVWYRVRGYNLDGVAGPYSDVLSTTGG